ncbi:hypothetical protein LCGC14_2265770, partial [marine sediment metagenome]
MAKITLDNLAHSYLPNPGHENDFALKELNHDWIDGEAYALLGASGCGKSTLLNIISGLLQPSQGRILFNDVDVTHAPTAERNIAQVFQFPVVYDTMTVRDNLAFPLRNRGADASYIASRVQQIAQMIGMEDELNRKARGLTANAKEKISLQLDEPVNKVVIDENYALMRQLTPEEIPPVLSGIMGRDKLIVVATARERARYKPLVDALGVKNIAYVTPDKITFTQMKENSFLIAGYDNTIVNMLFGKQAIPKEGVRIKVYKNPYNAKERIVLLHAKNKAEAKAVQLKISHYGKYSELAFKNGQNTYKAIAETGNGILVFSRPSTRVLRPDMLTTVDDIMPKLFASRIIYIGEKHDKFAHHINQLQIIKKMHV